MAPVILNLLALGLVIAMSWAAMVWLGHRFHGLRADLGPAEVPDDASSLLGNSAMLDRAPCDTCDGVGAGQVDGELMTCPACHGTGVIEAL